MSEIINTIIFDNIEVESDFRWLLKRLFAGKDINYITKDEINLIPVDSDLKSQVEMPAVTIDVFQSTSLQPDDVQLQTYTPFSVEINVYTSGDSKVIKNQQLCNEIIKIIQSNGQLPNYYCRGLMLNENTAMNSLIDSAYRRVLRFSGLCDNKLKLIKRR